MCDEGGKRGAAMNRVERAVLALQMVGPLCLKMRYKHFPRCCVEASQAGAEALRRSGLRANAVEVIMSVCPTDNDGPMVWLGATPDEAYDCMVELAGPAPMARDQFVADVIHQGRVDDPRHMVVEVGELRRYVLDLTACQIPVPGVPPAVRILCNHDGFPVEGDTASGHTVRYWKARREPQVEAAAYRNEGLTLDFMEAMALAKRCDLDVDRFAREARKLFAIGSAPS